MLEAILASKMYLSSNRKDRIIHAFNNPSNAQLIQQLDSYVTDKRFKVVDRSSDDSTLDTSIASRPESESSDFENDDLSTESTSGGFSGTLPGQFSLDDDETSSGTLDIDDSDVDTTGEQDDGAWSTPVSDIEPETSDVEESTSINATTSVLDSLIDKQEIIMSTLNSNSDSCGVCRVKLLLDKNEFWIYYDDKINLNSVMNPVIDLLNAVGYTYLTFSRLARSDNAIVFDINCSASSIDPIKDDENEK